MENEITLVTRYVFDNIILLVTSRKSKPTLLLQIWEMSGPGSNLVITDSTELRRGIGRTITSGADKRFEDILLMSSNHQI